MTRRSNEIDRIENVLAAHTIDLGSVIRDRSVKAGYTLGCACGYRWVPDHEVDHHRRHVASALAERLSIPPAPSCPCPAADCERDAPCEGPGVACPHPFFPPGVPRGSDG